MAVVRVASRCPPSPCHQQNAGCLPCAQDFDEYSAGYLTDSQVEIPIEGDDYDDELEALLYDDSSNGGRGRRGRRRQRS